MTKPLDEQAFMQYYLANPHISLVDIGKVFGRSDNTLRLVLKKHGVTRKRKVYSPEIEKRVVEEYNKCKIIEEVQNKCGVNRSTVSKILRTHGIEVRIGKLAKRRPDLSKAQQKLFNDHIPLVKTIIQQTGSWRAKLAGMDADDMLSVGMIGLWRAALTYDKNKNTAFSTLAYKTIKGEIFEAIEVARFGRRRHGRDLIDQSKFVEYTEVNENEST
jgi:DNA-directed RNA polymerase sigma subunit (sigma70/sigma32)